MNQIVLLLAALSAALIAGLFYGYSCSVNPGLGKLPDKEYLTAMQHINASILNAGFFFSFLGTLILLPVATWIHRSADNNIIFYLLLSAAVLYGIGVFGVTVAGNVPLNDQLANARLQELDADMLRKLRILFEPRWVMYHQIRTIASMVTVVLVIMACIKSKPS